MSGAGFQHAGTGEFAEDARARQSIRTELDVSVMVEASAGTGKTTELVNRIVAALRTGHTGIECIVAVTFTHKAAGELKVRLRQELDRARAGALGSELENLERSISRLEEAAIGTIHSFCAQVLRERPVEALVDPAFQELAEQEQQHLYDRAFRNWFERALNQDRPGLRRAFSRLTYSARTDELSPSEQLRIEGKRLVEWRDFQTPWRRDAFDRPAEMRDLAKAVIALARVSKAGRQSDALVQSLRPVREMEEWIERSRLRRTPDYDAIEALLLKLLSAMKAARQFGRGWFADGILRETVKKQREELIARLEAFKQRADADFAAALQADMLDLIGCYEDLKRRSGKLDFVDLLVKVRDLVRDNAAVRRHLRQRFTHFYIDEFQDTDPVQAELLLLLAASDPDETDWRKAAPEAGKLFLVGDPKQSIYKFRRADVLLYQQVRDSLVARGVKLVRLTVSHRASRPIQQCVNAAFEAEMEESPEKGQPGYVPLAGTLEPIEGQPPVIALPAPNPWGSTRITKTAIDACLPDTVAAFIHWLIHESGWKVRVPGEADVLVPVEARHIAVLFRRFVNFGKDLTREYGRSLEARRIRHLLVGSKSFHQREEIETLRAACSAIEWPSDELSVYATLKGSLFAVQDNLLLQYRMQVGHFRPLRPAGETDSAANADIYAPVTRALDVLAGLHRNRNERPVAETLNLLLEATRAHAGFALRPGGHQVIANVYRLMDLARSYEASGGISFRGFVEDLAGRADRAGASESPLLEESADGVRLMTVHTAKGLEFPVVILADMTANLASRDPEFYLDSAKKLCALRLMRCAPAELSENEAAERARDEAEGKRVAYVAATRARDLLVIPAVGDKPFDGWLSSLNKAIYPVRTAYRESQPHPACPVVQDRTVLPTRDLSEGAESVKPGVHRPEAGSHSVVWWDPAALKLNVHSKLGIADFELLMGKSEASADAYRDWRADRARALEQGSRPSLEITNPTDMLDAPQGIAVEFVKIARTRRAFGPRFGSLVHVILRDAVLQPSSVDRAAQVHGRSMRAEEDEIDGAIAAVRAALEHPLMVRARAASQCSSEVPISLRMDSGQSLEGNIDLAFQEAGVWNVVDYKTDSPGGARLAQYERQVAWYGEALRRITGLPVRCHLLSL